MAAPPRLTKLGAKWVEVRRRRARLPKRPERIWKRGQQHPLNGRSQASRSCLNLSQLLRVEAAGVGQPLRRSSSVSRV